MMKVLDVVEMAKIVCKAKKKPGIFLHMNGTIDEVLKAAPYLRFTENIQPLGDEHALVLCDSIKEQNLLFESTVGDEGPTKLNKYKGPGNVYALTIDKDGNALHENT